MNKFVQIGALLVGLLILGGSAVLYFGTNAANRIIDEANKSVEAGNTAARLGGKEYAELFTETNMGGFPANRMALAPTANSLAEHLNQAATQYEAAAGKYEEACKQNVPKVAAEYWQLKLDGFRKLAQSKQKFRAIALLLTDEGIATIEVLNEKIAPLVDEAIKLDAESKAFATKADDLRDKNKDSIN